MARTASPDKALEKFQQAVTDSENRFLSVAKAVNEIEGGSIWPTICENAALRLGVMWEVFHGDWAIAAISRRPSKFRNAVTSKLMEEVKDPWVRSALQALNPRALVIPDHPNLEQIRKLLDPAGYNVTFADSKSWVNWSDKYLADEFLIAAKRLASDAEATSFLHYLKKMRNSLAHSSNRYLDEFNLAVRMRLGIERTGLTGDRNSRLWRDGANGVNSIGAYLSHRPPNEPNEPNEPYARIFALHERLKETAGVLSIEP